MTPTSDPAAWRESLRLLEELAAQVDVVRPSHGPAISVADVREIRAAYEEVWAGARQPDDHRSADVGGDEPVSFDVFDYGRFTFLLAAGQYGDGA